MDVKLSTAWTIVLAIALVWELALKGVALWRAGRNNEPLWFVFLLVINSLGLLPIIYLILHSKVTGAGREE